MDQKIIHPVDILQELIAILTTRIDAVSKLIMPPEEEKAQVIVKQSERFINELVEELSNYGDAVQATAERDNQYQNSWKQVLRTVAGMPPDESEKIFYSLEQSLKSIYNELLDEENQLPPSIYKLISRQSNGILN